MKTFTLSFPYKISQKDIKQFKVGPFGNYFLQMTIITRIQTERYILYWQSERLERTVLEICLYIISYNFLKVQAIRAHFLNIQHKNIFGKILLNIKAS